MKLTNMATTVVASVFVVFSALGCCTKEKQEIAALMGENEELLNQKNDLQRQLSACDARLQSAMNQLDGKQAELAAAQARLQELEASQRQAPAVPQGWERGLVSDKVTVGTDILFAAGKATLTPQGKRTLDRIVNDLKTTYAGLPIRVYGHTDSDPIRKTKKLWQDNLDLSANRAMAVTRYLISKGISAKRIETVGMGEHHPVASNTTKAGKAKNRRVEIVVLKTG